MFLALVFLHGWGQAQDFKPAGSLSDWSYISTDNFDVYYNGGNERFAVEAATFAEIARFELGELYDFRPDLHYTLVYTSHPQELLHTNMAIREPGRVHGLFKLPDRTTYVIHPGTTKGLYQEVKRKVSDLILEEFKYGNRLSQTIQSQILLNNPDWFWKGLSDYVATGWTFEDEMWISSIRNEDALEIALEGNDKINRVVYKSIWHYIVHEYGEEKISEIIYLVNVSNSIESGIISVLGIQLSTLSERWREYIKDLADANASKRLSLNDIGALKQLPEKRGYRLTHFAFDPVHQDVAVYLNQQGKHSLWLYNPETQDYRSLGVQTGFQANQSGLLDFAFPMAWDPSGSRLATTTFEDQQLMLVIYDREADELTRTPVDLPLLWIRDLSWSHDGDYLAVSALHTNGIDIFTHRIGDAVFNFITQDAFDNIQPTWSVDDQYLFFSSNRDTESAEAPLLPEGGYLNHLDLYMIKLDERGEKYTRLTATPTVDESQPQPISGVEIAYLSDESGIASVLQMNVFQRTFAGISNLGQGIAQLQAQEGTAAFSTPYKGYPTLYWGDKKLLHNQQAPFSTLLRDEFDQAYERRLLQTRQKAQQQAAADREQAQTNPAPAAEAPQEGAPKAAESEEDKALRYYLFDEGTEYEVKKPSRDLPRIQTPRTYTVFGKREKPKMRDIAVSEALSAPNQWSADYIGWGINYDPLANLGVEMNIGFKDMLGNQRLEATIQPFINLKNWDADLRYEFTKYRWDLYAEIGTRTRRYRQESIFFPQDSLIYRFDQYFGQLGISYPLTSKVAVEGEAGFYRLSRIDQKLLRSELLDANDNIVQAGIRLRYQDVQDIDGYRYSGFDARIGMSNFYSLENAAFVLNNAYLNLRHYFPLKNKIVFASQLRSSISLFGNDQRFHMGGLDDLLLTLAFEKGRELNLTGNPISTGLTDFQFMEFLTPMRGFWFNSRVGTKYVLGNFELRLPLPRLLAYTLNSGSMYNLELIPFFDVGTVWTEGNPFSQKNPTDSRIVGSAPVTIQLQTLKSPFLFSLGSGLRANLMGYSVRLDMAWGIDDNTLQKPMMHLSMGKNF